MQFSFKKKILYNKILPHKKYIITNSGFLFKSFPNLIVWYWNKEDAIIMKVKNTHEQTNNFIKISSWLLKIILSRSSKCKEVWIIYLHESDCKVIGTQFLWLNLHFFNIYFSWQKAAFPLFKLNLISCHLEPKL